MARTGKVPLTDNQFAALVSFDFNTGAIAGEKQASFVRAMNRGDYDAVRPGLMQWVKSKKKTLRGLERRREAEGALFTRKHARNGMLSPIDFEQRRKRPPKASRKLGAVQSSLGREERKTMKASKFSEAKQAHPETER